MTKAALDALMAKQAGRGTVMRVVRALGGGARGRHYLDVLSRGIGRWLDGGTGSRSAPDHLQSVMASLLYRTGLPARRVYGVVDPTGRLGQIRDFRALRLMSSVKPRHDFANVNDWWKGVRSDRGGAIFEPLPSIPRKPIPVMRSERAALLADDVPDSDYMTSIGLMRSHDDGIGRRMINEWLLPLRPRLGKLSVPTRTAQVVVRPGETAAQAVQRDLMSRLNNGTRLSGQMGRDIIRNSRLALNQNGQVGGTILSSRLDDNPGTFVSRASNSSASPYGVQGAGSRVGDTVTYQPDVLMHEYGHMLQEFPGNALPGAWRRIGRMRAGMESTTSVPYTIPRSVVSNRTVRAWKKRYGDESVPLPDAAGWAGDPIQLFRRLSPVAYGEVAADVNAFGTNSRVWPLELRQALGSYIGSNLSAHEVLSRMPGATYAQRLKALREYARMAQRFVTAPEIPYSTAWNGTSRGVASW